MLSKKILINGLESYIQSNKNPEGEVIINWIASSIFRKINLVRINHDFITDVMRYDFLYSQGEILNLNGFDYSIADPDYSLIETTQISTVRTQSEVAIPALSFQSPVNLSPITAVSLFPINAAWKLQFGELAQETIVDWANLGFRQPFYSNITKTDEDATDANNGIVNVENAWGGDAALQYSIDDGATWHNEGLFTNLAPDTYLVKVGDGLGNESIVKEIEILAFESV